MSEDFTRKDSDKHSTGEERVVLNADTSVRPVWVKLISDNRNLLIIIGALAAVALIALILWSRSDSTDSTKITANVKTEQEEEHGEGGEHEEGRGVELGEEALEAAGIEIVDVSERAAIALLRVTGTVEANQQQTQQVTPLVSGRVERVTAALGDRVRAGSVLAVIASPEVAEMHGKLHEAETRLMLAEQNYARVQRAENRSSVIQARAQLDEAEATLRRTKRLVDLGAGAGKDLIAAEAAYKTAKAEYDYQSNISINREVQEARAEVETARVEVLHIRNSLRALGVAIDDGKHERRHDISTIALVAPVSGTVTERLVNAGAGIEAGKPLFTISNISTLWVIANVPEAQVGHLRVGTPAEVRAAALDSNAIAGRVTYIDPILNEETRTARVRIEVANPKELLKIAMFAEVGFETGASESGAVATELVVPEEAVQRLVERSVVFVPKDEPGHFEVRDVEVGGAAGGYRRVISGLAIGNRVVTKGSFTLKTQLMKGEMGEHSH
jgi:cobalt-zinc-cadmium efflux system membrane fusion protein